MEAQPWEAALDLDDSDLPSLLRPCKRRHPTTTASAASQPASSPEGNNCEQLQHQPPHSVSPHRSAIPGPAGAVQAAMLRKEIDLQNQKSSDHHDDNGEGFNGDNRNDGVISTQDYIRRAMEDNAEFDDDFTRHQWLSALQFLGAENDLIPSTPISSIQKCANGDKVVQVVAVIKSCKPNGLGGLIVLLKDPTGTVGASIHQKVVSQGEFRKQLTIGAVLILKEIAVFSPVRSAHYLNITQKNLVKVFCQDSDSTSKIYNSACPVQYADPGYCGKAKTVEKMPTMQNLRQEGTEKRQCLKRTESSQNHSIIQRQNLFTGSIRSNNRGSMHVEAATRGHTDISQDACNEVLEEAVRARNHQGFVNGSKNGATQDNLEESDMNSEYMTNPTTKSGAGAETQGSYEVEKQRQPLITKASQWTDEQLDQLFAGDDEIDDGSLF